MELDIAAWLGLALRWLHFITGIAWIGSSFYFIWLDNSLTPPVTDEDKKNGVGGELWAVHGGGFYHKKKYKVAPPHMPEGLHWFKWEAYFTWLSGFLLLSLIYYFGADQYLIDNAKYPLTQPQAIATGLVAILAGWVFYDTLCKTPIGENNALFGVIWFGALTLMAYALNEVFSDRGAYIHMGAIIGTVMAANVFMIIIPNQRKTVVTMLEGGVPDPAYGLKAKQRSLHNNYMTLPVLFIMISNHYPQTYGHSYNWAILAGLGATAWFIRHFFNLKHKGKVDYRFPAIGVIGFIAVACLASLKDQPAMDVATQTVSDAEVKQIIRTHCSACHSDTPTHPDWHEAPLGAMFDTMAEIKQYAPRIYERAVATDTMPLGNETAMTAEERTKLGTWIKALAHE